LKNCSRSDDEEMKKLFEEMQKLLEKVDKDKVNEALEDEGRQRRPGKATRQEPELFKQPNLKRNCRKPLTSLKNYLKSRKTRQKRASR
jgi:hypothetical protein